MLPFIIVVAVLLVVLGVILLVGKALGQPKLDKFDETPADVHELDLKS